MTAGTAREPSRPPRMAAEVRRMIDRWNQPAAARRPTLEQAGPSAAGRIRLRWPVVALLLAGCAGRSPAPAAPSASERIATSERLTRAGHLAEGEAILWPALRTSGGAERAGLLLQLGTVRLRMAWFWDARPDLASESIEEALAIAERISDPDLLAEGHDAA